MNEVIPWFLAVFRKQGKSEGFDSCNRLRNLTQIGLKSLIFQPDEFDEWHKKNLCQALYIISKPWVNSNWRFSLKTLILGQNPWIFVPCDLEILQMTLKNNRAPLLCYFKLCASFQSQWWIQTGVTVGKRQIWVKMADFLYRATLRFDRWPWKTIGHLVYATSSFVHRFKDIDEFKLELQFRNAKFGSKSTIFIAQWPWNLMDDLENQ